MSRPWCPLPRRWLHTHLIVSHHREIGWKCQGKKHVAFFPVRSRCPVSMPPSPASATLYWYCTYVEIRAASVTVERSGSRKKAKPMTARLETREVGEACIVVAVKCRAVALRGQRRIRQENPRSKKGLVVGSTSPVYASLVSERDDYRRRLRAARPPRTSRLSVAGSGIRAATKEAATHGVMNPLWSPSRMPRSRAM